MNMATRFWFVNNSFENNEQIDYSSNELYDLRLLGAFDTLRLIGGVNQNHPSIANSLIMNAYAGYHEREHYLQTISTSLGFWNSFIRPSSMLLLLKELTQDLRTKTKVEKFLCPIPEWIKTEKDPLVRELLINTYIEYVQWIKIDKLLAGLTQWKKDESHLFKINTSLETSSPMTRDGTPIGYIALMEGIAQVKSFLCLEDYEYWTKSDSERKEVVKVKHYALSTMKNSKLYGSLTQFTSELLEVDLFNEDNLVSYGPLLQVAADYALMAPWPDMKVSGWEEIHPGWRFFRCISLGKRILKPLKDFDARKKYHKIINDEINEATGWIPTVDVIYQIVNSELSDTTRLKGSPILSTYQDAMTIRMSQPYIFAFSDDYVDALMKHFRLPSEMPYFKKIDSQEKFWQWNQGYLLPYLIRPAVIEQLFHTGKMVCPKKPGETKFPIDIIKSSIVPGCNYSGFQKPGIPYCIYRILLNDLGLNPSKEGLLIRRN